MTAGGHSESYCIPAARAVVSPLGDSAPGSLCSCSEAHPLLHFTEQWNRGLLQRLVATSSPSNVQSFFVPSQRRAVCFRKTLLVRIPACTHSALVWGFQNTRLTTSPSCIFKCQGFSWSWVFCVLFFFPPLLYLPQCAHVQMMTP